MKDIYRLENYDECVEYAYRNNLTITEIEPDEQGRRFIVEEIPKPTEQELAEQRILELKQKLKETDYQPLKYLDGEYTEEEYAVLKAQRQAWREEIRQLEEKLS